MLVACDAQVSPPLTEYTLHDYRNLVFGDTLCNLNKNRQNGGSRKIVMLVACDAQVSPPP